MGTIDDPKKSNTISDSSKLKVEAIHPDAISRDWLKIAKEHVENHMQLRMKTHPSFADAFWLKETVRLGNILERLQSKSVDGLTEQEAARIKAFRILIQTIQDNIERHSRRDHALEEAAKIVRRLKTTASGSEKVNLILAELFLRNVLRKKSVSLESAFAEVSNKSSILANSEEFRMAMALRHEAASIHLAGGALDDVEATWLGDDVEDEDDLMSEISETEEMHNVWRLRFELSRKAAERYIESIRVLDSSQIVELLRVRIETLRAECEDLEYWRLDSRIIGTELTEEFLNEFIAALNSLEQDPGAREEGPMAIHQHIQTIIGLRCQIAALEKLLAERDRVDFLGRKFDGLLAIAVNAAKMHANYAREEKSIVVLESKLEVSREALAGQGALLVRDFGVRKGVERMDKDDLRGEYIHVAEKLSTDQELLKKFHIEFGTLLGIRERITALAVYEAELHAEQNQVGESSEGSAAGLLVPTAEQQVSASEKPQGRFRRALRKPGRWILGLFGTGAVVAGGIALHNFTENDSDQPDFGESVAEDDGALDAGSDTGGEEGASEVDQVGDEGGAQEQPRDSQKSFGVTDTYEVQLGDTVWGTTVRALRERGLPTSNALTQYFTHQALVNNGLDAMSALHIQPGVELNLSAVIHEMDKMAQGDAEDKSLSGALEIEPVEASGGAVGSSMDGEGQQTHSRFFAPEKAGGVMYSEFPSASNTEHVMKKGEYIYKMIHLMLRQRNLNWTTERINFLSQLVVDQNAPRFRAMVEAGEMQAMHEEAVPTGAVLDFADAIAVMDDMETAKQEGKKSKSVRQLAKERGYPYPIMMKFPTE